MGEEEPAKNIVYCTECGAVIKPEEKLCPNCSSGLNQIITENQQDVLVILKTLPTANSAGYIKNLLAASGIMSKTRPSPTDVNADAVSVLVCTHDLEKAKNSIKDPANEPKATRFSYILKLTFSIAGKTLKTNAILILLSIAAALLVVIGFNLLLFSHMYIENNLIFIYPQMEQSQYIYLEAAGSGNNKLFFIYPDNCKKLIKLNDTIWMYSDSQTKEWIAGYISEIEEANGTNRTANKVYVNTLDKDIITQTGTKYRIIIKDPAPKVILTIDNKAIYNKDGRASVYIMVNGKAKSVGIITGTEYKGRTEVLSGISMSDILIESTTLRKDNLRDGIDVSPRIETKYIINFIFFVLAILIFRVTVTALYYGITKAASLTIEKKEYSANKIFRNIFSASFLKALISDLSLAIIITGPFITALLFIDKFDLLNMTGGILIFLVVSWCVYASIKYNFTFVHSVISGEGVINSFNKSSSLVKTSGVRTFAILLLVSIIINLITSFISIPIADFIAWDIIDHPKDFDTITQIEILKHFTVIIIPLFIILKSFIDPVFTTVMYYDLRNRKGEFYFLQDIPETPEVKSGTSESGETA